MSYIYTFILFLSCTLIAGAQSAFFSTYDFGTVENSYQIVKFKGRIYVNTATLCNVECSYLSEINENGVILWRTEIPDIDIASTMVVVNDTITITGNNDPFNTAFRMAHFSLDGQKLGPTFEIEHPTKKYTNMFQLTTQYFNNRFVLGGPGRQGDTSRSLIYVVNSLGVLDTLITLEPTNHESDLWESYIDNAGRLTTYHWVEFGHSDINYRKIFKFDSNYDTVWTYTSELNDDNAVIPKGCELQDGRTVLSYVNPDGNRFIHSIRAINQDGSVDWQHDYFSTGSRERYIIRLNTLSNGDIMGCGMYSELTQIPRISSAPWLFRMNSEGDLLWEHAYVEYDSIEMESRGGPLLDFIEMDNGDIIAVGTLYTDDDDDMLVMRVDSNGCLYSNNCHQVNILTRNEASTPVPSSISIYPNPVYNKLYIELSHSFNQRRYEVLDIKGQIKLEGILNVELEEINVESLPTGIYFIQIFENNVQVALKKVIKIESNR